MSARSVAMAGVPVREAVVTTPVVAGVVATAVTAARHVAAMKTAVTARGDNRMYRIHDTAATGAVAA
jgi:hypothetical protein